MATCTNCGYCTYMDVTKEKEGKFYCEHLDGYQFADSEDSKDCNYQCERFSRDMYLGDDAIKVSKAWKKSHSSSGCFITTVVVNILGYDDNCEILSVLRKFRDTYLQKDSQYRGLLMQYDVIGPVISNKILEDKDSYDVSIDLYFDHLIPCVDSLKQGDVEAAILKYVDMVNMLKNKYLRDANLEISSEIEENYDQSIGGHGRLAFN